jgi:uncharacterized damage-inducible protein DinB
MDLLDRLLEHDHWATAQLMEMSDGFSDAQLDQPFDIGHRTLRATFEHIIVNIEGWTEGMSGQAANSRQDDHSLAALVDRHEHAHQKFATFARWIRDEQRLDDTFGDPSGEQMTFGGGILHVILHDEDHRTEAMHILQRLGVQDPIEVDHGLWDFVRRG